MKFARNVHFEIKDGKNQEFTRLFNEKVIPVLKKQPGFDHELTLMESRDDSHRGMGISIWNDRKSAEQYESSAYKDVLRTLEPVLSGSPTVDSWQIGANTLG